MVLGWHQRKTIVWFPCISDGKKGIIECSLSKIQSIKSMNFDSLSQSNSSFKKWAATCIELLHFPEIRNESEAVEVSGFVGDAEELRIDSIWSVLEVSKKVKTIP